MTRAPGAISVHGINGAWGVLALGIFADGTYGSGWNGIDGNVKGLLYGDPGQFMAQVAHVVVGFIWAWGITWLPSFSAKKFIAVRVSPEVELQGLDMPEFGTVCYPDFQLVSHPDHVINTTHDDPRPRRPRARRRAEAQHEAHHCDREAVRARRRDGGASRRSASAA